MRTKTVSIFQFHELSDKSKEKARDWYRQGMEFDSEFVIEDAATIADLFGLDIQQTRKSTGDSGKWIYTPSVYWSGFWSQGDGACFESRYRYKKGGLKAVKEYAPQDTELHSIAKRLQRVQARNFYQIVASTKQRGHYYHELYMDIDVERADELPVSDDDIDTVKECLRDFARWIYKALEREYQNADENVDESIEANEYEFDENGVPA